MLNHGLFATDDVSQQNRKSTVGVLAMEKKEEAAPGLSCQDSQRAQIAIGISRPYLRSHTSLSSNL